MQYFVLSKEASYTIYLGFWYNSTWYWTQISLTTDEHSTH